MKEYIFFLIFFAPLRSHAGGIHMNTWQGCCIMSNIVVFLLTFLSGQIPENVVSAVTAVVLIFLSVCGIWIWSPCENKNNPLPEDVKQKCKAKARFWSVAICLIAVFCVYLGITSYAFMCVEMELLSVLLIGLEKIINLRKRGKKYEDSSM
jgi:accessory gene regulator protein AgrB